jgi:hypothetical protein
MADGSASDRATILARGNGLVPFDRGQSQLKHHKTVRPAAAADRSGGGAASFAENVGDSWLRRLQRRHETEEQRRGQTHTCGEHASTRPSTVKLIQ